MPVIAPQNLRLLAVYFVIVLVSCSPVLGVEYFTNPDGLPHLYNAYLLAEIVRGNEFYTEWLGLNSLALPNSSGHWIMAALLQFFPPSIVTKMMVVLTFAGIVACVGWLRYRTVGRDGMGISLLFGAVLAFNWLWLLGFYNFMIGFVLFVFAIALVSGWRGMTIGRTVILSLIFLVAYISHLVSFAATAGSVVILLMFSGDDKRWRNVGYSLLALLPVIPLAISFKMLSAQAGDAYPVWRSLESGWSISNVVRQLYTVDPFTLLNRRAFPFTDAVSIGLAAFATLVWMFAAFILLSAATIRDRGLQWIRQRRTLPFAILFAGLVTFAIFAPDDFGLQHGNILRERVMLCGLALFVPLFRLNGSTWLKYSATAVLVFIILFQTAVVWEYSLKAEATTKEFLTAGEALEDGDSIASVMIVEQGWRFHAMPEANLNTLHGINRRITIWDNYELGHYLFPVVTRDSDDRRFILDLCGSHAFARDAPEDFDAALVKLEETLEHGNSKLNKIVILGWDENVGSVVHRWFDPRPIFSNGRVRVLRHR